MSMLNLRYFLYNSCQKIKTSVGRVNYSSTPKSLIDKVLIANRGEIACRVIRTAKRLGIKTVSVFSDVDINSMHTKLADEAYNIGPPPPQQSYLLGDKILEVAQRSRCKAIHPGYGFLSENTEFALSCQNSNIIFIGPPASAIRDMGIKSTSKAIMIDAGVSVIQGYHGEDQSVERLREEAKQIGYPVMIKAVRGGGGKGMRIALDESEFQSQLDSAKNEAMKSFGNNDMLIEKYVQEPRHVEVQVFGDQHGNYVYLFERDCSVQRRHQKIIEEAPAPGLSKELRKRLGEEAVKAARAVNYVGAGTVEFILDKKTNEYYFMEMNTRLQVEHPVTEMITGTDLVEWQFKVANGDQLPLTQDQIKMNGHAFEARIYAEDPNNGFLPGAGPLLHLTTPPPAGDVRIETGVSEGDNISVYYDPMIAKLVVWGADRSQALLKFTDQLVHFNVGGLETNINFLISLSRHKEFMAGNVHTDFIPQYEKELFSPKPITKETIAYLALTKIFSEYNENYKKISKSGNDVYNTNDPFVSNAGFRVNHFLNRTLTFDYNNKQMKIDVVYLTKDSFRLKFKDGDQVFDFTVTGSFEFVNKYLLVTCNINGEISKCKGFISEEKVYLFTDAGCDKFEIPQPKYLTERQGKSVQGDTVAPMPGVIDKIFALSNQTVKTGDPLLVLIAMKMEYVIKAPKDGIIDSVLYKVGDSVKKNAVLVKFAA